MLSSPSKTQSSPTSPVKDDITSIGGVCEVCGGQEPLAIPQFLNTRTTYTPI